MTMPSNFTSSGSQLFFKFRSDGSATGPGFLISYDTVIAYCSLTLCKEGEGDCNLDSQCEGSLVCGHMNCMNSTITDCCTQSCSNDTECTSGDCNMEYNQCYLWSDCSPDAPCAYGEGHCDDHTDCDGTLLCGNDNCASGPTGMDCCTDDGN